MSDEPRCYAILPAAGRSRRMGQPKLLLPWPMPNKCDVEPSVATLIDHVLQVWTSSRVDEIVVIVRSDDQALLKACLRWKVSIVQPEMAPSDMKESVQHGLRYLQKINPGNQDCCFVAPADIPTLSANVIDRLIDTDSGGSTIVVPSYGGRSGHPVRLPWLLADEILALRENEGVDRVVARHPKIVLEFPAEVLEDDIDTPEEYQSALKSAFKRNNGS